MFMCLQAARALKDKFLIETAAPDADAEISLEELQNTVEMEQEFFNKPS